MSLLVSVKQIKVSVLVSSVIVPVLFIFCTLANKPVKSTLVEDTLFSAFCFGQHASAYALVETDRFVGKPPRTISQNALSGGRKVI